MADDRRSRRPLGARGAPFILTADLAREEALRLRGEKAAGNDPAAKRDAAKGTPTLAGLAERFLDEYVKPFKKPRTAAEYERLLSKVILPRLGRIRLDQLQARDVAQLRLALRATPTEANRALAVISKTISWSETIGLRPKGNNPVRGLPRFKEAKRERFLAPTELGRLAQVLLDMEADQPVAVAAIRLLLFTGCRLSEILTLKWGDVDVEAGVLRLPDSKTGAKVIYLNAPAKAVLAAIPKLSGNPYVLTGRKNSQHFVGLNHIWMRLRSRALLPNVRLHDLRHSFASVAVSAGASLPLIGGLLGHSNAATTERYAHLGADPLRDVAERTGERIAAAMKAGARKGAAR